MGLRETEVRRSGGSTAIRVNALKSFLPFDLRGERVESEPGRTSFQVRLPFATDSKG